MSARSFMQQRFTIGLVALAAALVLCSPAMGAGRAYVASGAPNIGSCLKAAPCGDINYAIRMVNEGGTVIITDSEMYPPFTVPKSVTVKGAGSERPEIRHPYNVNYVTISAAPSDEVTLRNLDLRGYLKGRGTGVYINNGEVELDNVRISRLLTGVTTHTYAEYSLVMDDSRISGNATGVAFRNGTWRAIDIDRTKILSNDIGIDVWSNTTITNSRISNNGTAVRLAEGSTCSRALIRDSRINNNQLALDASRGMAPAGGGCSVIGVGHSTVAFNWAAYLPNPCGFNIAFDDGVWFHGNHAAQAPTPSCGS